MRFSCRDRDICKHGLISVWWRGVKVKKNIGIDSIDSKKSWSVQISTMLLIDRDLQMLEEN